MNNEMTNEEKIEFLEGIRSMIAEWLENDGKYADDADVDQAHYDFMMFTTIQTVLEQLDGVD